MAFDDKQPIIVKKVKNGQHGFHGGAWKLAYADFVTAMMAFFLLMWLLGSTTEAQKKGIADYFQNPLRVSLSGGATSGDTTSVLPGGGLDISHDVGQVNLGDSDAMENLKHAGDADEHLLEALNENLRQAIEMSPLLKEYRDQLKIDFTRDGLRIQIVDARNRPMFPLGSGRLLPHAQQILAQITPLLTGLPNKVSIIGHTDATPYGQGREYTNWELSADRANAARRIMVQAGMAEDQVVRASGMASIAPFDHQSPRAPVNRRIAILVLNQRALETLMSDAGTRLVVEDGQVRPEGAVAPSERQ
jgi:chemotaxis protein MotB